MKSLLRSIQMKLVSILVRGIVRRTNDETGVQIANISLRRGEFTTNIEHPQEFGFSSNCPEDSEAIVAFFGGDKDHGVSLVQFNRKERKNGLTKGETVLYNAFGCYMYFKVGGTAEVAAPAGLDVLTALLSVTGNITDGSGITLSQMRSIYNSHTHNGGSSPDQKME